MTNLSSPTLANLIMQLSPSKQSLKAGQMLFQQGEQVKSFYLVEEGLLKLIRNSIDGKELVHVEASEGSTIAEASLFSDTYQCMAIAAQDTAVISCSKRVMLDALKSNPEVMFQLLKMSSKQVRDLRAISEIKNIKKSRERILTYFRVFADLNGEIDLSPSMKDVASRIGITHETFYRELAQLEKKSQIVRSNKIVKIIY